MNRYVLKEIIKSKFGLVADEAINGRDCLQLVKEKGLSECCSEYKIIFMDFEMPILNGIEASKKIKKYKLQGKVNKDLVLVAYTAYTDEEANCKESGMDFFLPKPASLDEIQAILRMVNRKLANNVATLVENDLEQETFLVKS